MQIKKIPFYLKIFIGLALGVGVGVILIPTPQIAENYFAPIGQIYMNLLKFIIGPVVFMTVVSGISSMQSVKKVGKTGVRAVLFYFFTTAFAVTIGLICAFLFKPLFNGINIPLQSEYTVSDINFRDMIIKIFPSNFFGSFVNGDILQVLIAALLFGIAILKLNDFNFEGIKSLEKIVINVMDAILKFSPIGVFALIVPVVANTGFSVLKNLISVVVCVYIAFVLHVIFVYMPILFFKCKIGIINFLKTMLPTIAIAFSTASSISAMPVNLKCTQILGADKDTADFIIPLGATINMDGTGIYQGVCVVFIATCFGIDLSILQCIALIASVTLASVGTAGVPGAGILMLTIALQSVGLPAEGIALIAGVDRIFDMGRTAMNVLGDSACALFVSSEQNRAI